MLRFGTEPDKHTTIVQNSALAIPDSDQAINIISNLIHGNPLFLQDGRANSLTMYIPGDLINTVIILVGIGVIYIVTFHFGHWTIRVLDTMFEYSIASMTVMVVCMVLNVYWNGPQ